LKRFVYILILLACTLASKSQDNVSIHSDPRLDTLLQRSLKIAEAGPATHGYRIQLYSGSNRQMANQIKSQFMQTYSDYRAYLVYAQPYFKIRVGDFHNRAEALKLFNSLKMDERFKVVLIVPDKIELPPLK